MRLLVRQQVIPHKSYPENMYLLAGSSDHVARKPPISFFDHFLGRTRACEAFSCGVVAVQRIPPATTSHPTFGRQIAVCESFVDRVLEGSSMASSSLSKAYVGLDLLNCKFRDCVSTGSLHSRATRVLTISQIGETRAL